MLQASMINNVKIRIATITDSFNIFRLLIKESENKTDQDLKSGNYYRQWEPVFLEMVNSELCKVFIVLDDKKIIGLATVYLLPRLELAKKYAILEDVFIKETERSKGIGSILIKEIVTYLKKTNEIKYLSAAADYKNEKVVNFYKKLGFKINASDMQLKF